MTAFTCPDCGATAPPSPLEHAGTCPLGRASDERSDRDRQWFTDHPHADRYWRDLDAAEIAELRVTGAIPPDGEITGRVQVVKIADDVRVRRFQHLTWWPAA